MTPRKLVFIHSFLIIINLKITTAQDEIIRNLVEMGYTIENARQSVSAGNNTVEDALDWLELSTSQGSGIIEHEANPSLSSSTMAESNKSEELLADNDQRKSLTSQENLTPCIEYGVNPSSSSLNEAKSYKCEDCNKLFTDTSALQYHSTRYGHSNFSESTEEKKPLTEEEKKEQKKKLEELLKEKRKQREAMEKTEEIEREKNSIRSGKDMTAAKKKLEEQNLKKIINERIRDKEEEKKAREQVKAKIKADRLESRVNRNNVFGQKQPEKIPITSNRKTVSKNYTETTLKIRLTNGETLLNTFKVTDSLAAVKLYIDQNRSDGDSAFRLITNFPLKVFTTQDYTKTLSKLNLVPRVVIIMSQFQL